MGYIPVTPFRRAIKAAVTKHQSTLGDPPAPLITDKWKILRELSAARRSYGLSDRDLAVLQALLSFHKTTDLDLNTDLVVHPSNASICERLNGMPCSTMRRHIARLVDTGILTRRDSPNGKRYVRRYAGSRIAYGFDLTPFARRAGEFSSAASAIRTAMERTRHLRETISLKRRDLAHLAEEGRQEMPDLALWDQLSDLTILTSRSLRRKLTDEDLQQIESHLDDGLNDAKDVLQQFGTIEMGSSSTQNEQDHQNIKEDLYKKKIDGIAYSQTGLDLGLVLTKCTEIQTYSEKPIRTWQQLYYLADWMRPMLGLSEQSWQSAVRHMGINQATGTLAAMLQRFDEIRSPEGYLRHLNKRAEQGRYCAKTILASLKPPVSSQL